MSIGNTTETDVIAKLFNNTAISWDANTNLYVSLHTGDPGEAGSQTTSEISYTGYARVAVARTTSGWTAANPTTNVAAVTFGQMTAGTGGTVSYVAIGTASSGAGQIICSGACSPTIAVSNGVTPSFAIGALSFALD